MHLFFSLVLRMHSRMKINNPVLMLASAFFVFLFTCLISVDLTNFYCSSFLVMYVCVFNWF